jgi:hypothetical protein
VFGSQYLMEAPLQQQKPIMPSVTATDRSWYNMIPVELYGGVRSLGHEIQTKRRWNHAWGAVP